MHLTMPKPATITTLSVRQPWAELILTGRKTIELRTWTTRHRGPLLITASAGPPTQEGRVAIERHRLVPELLLRGRAVCVVDLVDVRPAKSSDAGAACCAPGAEEFAWVLANPRRVRGVAIKGRLGLFDHALPTGVF